MARQGWEAGFPHFAWQLLRPRVADNHRGKKQRSQKQIYLRELVLFHLLCRCNLAALQERVLRNCGNNGKHFGVFFLSVLRGSLRPPCWPNDERLMECCTATPKQTHVRGSLIQTEYGESFTSTLAWKPHTWKFQWLNDILWSRNDFI